MRIFTIQGMISFAFLAAAATLCGCLAGESDPDGIATDNTDQAPAVSGDESGPDASNEPEVVQADGVPDSSIIFSKTPMTKAYRIEASPEECDYVRAQHPGVLPDSGPCFNTLTVHSDGEQQLPATQGGQTVAAAMSRPKTGWTELCGPLCSIWHSKVTTSYKYNGKGVWQQWVDCSDYGGTGYNVDVKWCSYWNNGGGNGHYYMNMGDNIQVSFVYKGSPVHRGYWQRFNVAVNGNWWLTGSGR